MAKKKKSDRLIKCREFNVKEALQDKTVPELIEYLSGLQLPEGARLYLSTQDYYGDYEATAVFEYYEEENDEEYAVRMNNYTIMEAAERRQYELLKKKYEGKGK